MPRAFKTKMCIIGKVTTMQENTFWGMPWKSIKICVSPTRVSHPGPRTHLPTGSGIPWFPPLARRDCLERRDNNDLVIIVKARPGRASFSAF